MDKQILVYEADKVQGGFCAKFAHTTQGIVKVQSKTKPD